MKCITGARYTMLANVLIQSAVGTGIISEFDRNGMVTEREVTQDPDSGAIEREWVDAPADGDLDTIDAGTPYSKFQFVCSARGFADGGLRVVGTAERFSSRGYIDHADYVILKFPGNVHLSNRDRITNIRDAKSGQVLWTEEDGDPTQFEVTGVTPIFDPFGKVIENSALLTRADVQGDLSGP